MYTQDLLEKIRKKSLVVGVFGLGRIGLPTAVEFAVHGYKVIGVDINKKLLEDLRKSETFVDEPGLPELLQKANRENMIEFTDNGVYAVKNSDVIVICLPTPIDEDRVPDYSIVESVAHLIGKNMRKGQVVIVESSVSPTTVEHMVVPILKRESGLKYNEDFAVCSCPERADPGKIIDNFDRIPRIVGGSCPEITEAIAELYKNITNAKILKVSNPATANAIKLTENIFRDVNIALMNELAVLYEHLGVNIKEVITGCSTKYNFQPHYPGPGVGGPCLPVNPYYIMKDAYRVDYVPFLIRIAREVNDRMPEHVAELVVKALNEIGAPVKGTPIAILGISYKANVKDIQNSPSIKVMRLLRSMGASLRVYDPFFEGEFVEDFHVLNSVEDTVKGTKALVILTDHKIFTEFDFKKLIDLMESPIIIDSRNILDKSKLPSGTVYCGVGHPLTKL